MGLPVGLGYWILDLGYRILDIGYWIWDMVCYIYYNDGIIFQPK